MREIFELYGYHLGIQFIETLEGLYDRHGRPASPRSRHSTGPGVIGVGRGRQS